MDEQERMLSKMKSLALKLKKELAEVRGAGGGGQESKKGHQY